VKTIINKTAGLSMFLIADEHAITEEHGMLKIGPAEGKQEYYIGNPKPDELTVYDNGGTVPADWRAGKYSYNGKKWISNPNYKQREPRSPRTSNEAPHPDNGAT